MKNYLALDSGGTKVLAILYNESFRIQKVCRVGSLRENTTSKDLIQKNVEEMFNGLGLSEIDTIDHIAGTVDSVLFNRISKGCTIKEKTFCSELELGLSAAGIFEDGLLALTGTGATLFSRYGGKIDVAGGYGAAVSDAGSGYWMGRHAMEAAIAYDEDRGEATLLRDMITAHFRKGCLKDSVFSIYSRSDTSPAASVASCAPLITEAAYLGDKIAHDIIISAGKVLGEQLLYLIKKHNIPKNVPITISGSIWKGHHDLFGEFKRVIHTHDSERPIIIPEFEPIVGAVIYHFYKTNGSFGKDDLEFFRNEYSQFGFSINQQ